MVEVVSEIRSVTPRWLALPLRVCDNTVWGFQSRNPWEAQLFLWVLLPPGWTDTPEGNRVHSPRRVPCWLFDRKDGQEVLDAAPGLVFWELGQQAGVGNGSSLLSPCRCDSVDLEKDVPHF